MRCFCIRRLTAASEKPGRAVTSRSRGVINSETGRDSRGLEAQVAVGHDADDAPVFFDHRQARKAEPIFDFDRLANA